MSPRWMAVALLAPLFLAACERHTKVLTGEGPLEPVIRVQKGGSNVGEVELSVPFASLRTTNGVASGSFVVQVSYGMEVTLSVSGGTLQQWSGGPCDGTNTVPCVFVAAEDATIQAILN